MPTQGPVRAGTTSSADRPCPACGSSANLHIGAFGVDDQLREYAGGDAVVHAELVRRSGLPFARYDHLQCPACGLRFSSPMLAPSGDWYSYAYNQLEIHAASRWEFGHVLDRLAPADRIGEIGCGTGMFLAGARQRGIDAQGLDFSAGSVAECVRKGLDARTVDVDFDDLQVSPDRTAIASFHVLEHLGEPAKLFALASRWAAPDAVLWLAVPSDRNMTRLKGQRDLLDEPPHHLTQWTPEALRRLGAANGWALEHVLHEHMGARQRLWTLCTDTPLYRRLARRPGLAAGWPNRLLRYLLYPAVALGNWDAVRKLSGLSMLARYRRSGP